jgi:hypothetical protein
LASILAAKAKRPKDADFGARGGEEAEGHEQPRQEAEALYKTLADQYGDIRYLRKKTYADLARSGIARLRPNAGTIGTLPDNGDEDDAGTTAQVGLEVGMRSPEVTGLDTSGRPMKLSDYRGAVVVLDFWGDW